MRRSALTTALLSSLLLPAAVAGRPQAPAAADAASLALGLLSGPGMADTAQELYLEVRVNGVPIPRVMQVLIGRDEHAYAWADNLQQLGIGGVAAGQYVDLGSIAGLRYRIDTPNQRLELDADVATLRRPTQHFSNETDHYRAAGAISGALLNYAVGASGSEDQRSISLFSDWRGFGSWGVIDSTALSNWRSTGGDDAYRRLDTTYRYSSQDALWTLSAGDFISDALSWSRSTRLGGLQWRRDFGLQPGLVTFPLPAFFGQAALPSTLELYVNGVREFQGQADPGRFRIDTVPHLNGAGAAQLVVTDALGRREVVNFSFYAAQQLLRAGYLDYSAELGVVRRDYGLSSFAYDDRPAGSGMLRYGLSDVLTVEAHGEGSEGLALAGAGAAARIGRLGVVSGAYAQSRSDGANGAQWSLGHTWSNGRITTDLNSLRASAGYRDLASRDSRAPPRASDRALFGVGLAAAGSVSFGYTRLIADDDGRFRYLSLQYSVSPLPRLSTYAGYSHDLDRRHSDLVFVGLSWSFANRVAAGLDLQDHDGSLRSGASLVRPLSPDGGYGWNVHAQHGDGSDSVQAAIAARANWGQVEAGLRRFDEQRELYGSLEGSLVFVDRDWFAARRIDDAFALVSTDGIADVPVSLENRPIGRTDAHGHYLLTGLKPWQANQLSIDTLGLPAQIQTRAVRMSAVPAGRRAVKVDFDLRRMRAALVVLRDANGDPLPLGSRVRRGDDGPAVVVGYDGQAYLEELELQTPLAVTMPDGHQCTANLDLASLGDELPIVDPLPCR